MAAIPTHSPLNKHICSVRATVPHNESGLYIYRRF